jgi:hypothetical protein
MIRAQSGGHSEGRHKLAGDTRVFRADDIDGRKNVEGSERNVPQVADRSRNNVEPRRKPWINTEKAGGAGFIRLPGIILQPSFRFAFYPLFGGRV